MCVFSAEIGGGMEVSVQEDVVPGTPSDEQNTETRDPRTASRTATLAERIEMAENIADSVLGSSSFENRVHARLRQSERATEGSTLEAASNRLADALVVDLREINREINEGRTALENGDPTDWIRMLLTEDAPQSVERNANVIDQEASSSTSNTTAESSADTSVSQAAPAQTTLPVSAETCARPSATAAAEQASSTEQAQAQPQQQQSAAAAQQTESQQGTQEAQQQQPSQSQEPQLPDGVDPSFLAALPEEMRDEVIAEQLRLQRIRQRAQAIVVEDLAGPAEVNPEFLAALPPAIQEEVLAQQRIEQQRHAAAAANPEDPVDAAAFFQNLQPSLRQAILTDMEESQISVLPPELAQEAQNLRREWEARNRHMMQERFLSHVGQAHNTTLSSILRNTGRGRGNARYAIHTVPHGRAHQWNSWAARNEPGIAHQGAAGLRLRGRQLLDHESMACLLVLLFIDEPKINTLRLHRVIRNLCYHGSTREWVVKALLNIMERSNDESKDMILDFGGKFKKKGGHSAISYCSPKSVEARSNAQSWLNISIDAALGCRANVFYVTRHGGKKSERQGNAIAIHPQAAQTVCRHTLELLIALAKNFPGYFVPTKNKETEEKDLNLSKEETGTKPKSASKAGKNDLPDFWDMLLKLDSCASKKGKSVARTHSYSSLGCESEQSITTFEASAFGQLISMLNWTVVRRSSQLTDKLLRLLSLISIGLTEVSSYNRRQDAKNKKVEASKEISIAAPEGHLRLAVQVLTSKSCSEEGLEDATALLLNLSHCPDPTRHLILKLLMEGAMELANMVCEHINDLMMELKILNRELSRRNSVEEQPSTSSGGSNRGTLTDRFTCENVVITAPSKVKAATDLQLPSMGVLVSKTSSQAFFLRILKVIVQIREAVRLASKKKNDTPAVSTDSTINLSAAEQAAAPQPTTTTTEAAAATAAAPAATAAAADPDSSAMDTAQANTSTLDTAKPTASSSAEEEKPALPTLSDSLVLDNLWETLSACLLELEHTPDHHAVLVLQPAVEAFFLVHSSSSSSASRDRNNETHAENRDVVPDLAPVSPIYSDNEGAHTESANNASYDLNSSQQKLLPPDQVKFLKFAETHRTVLNQILRQTTTHLADGPFSVLVDHTRVLDFDVKRRYFRTELDRMDEGIRREELAVHVRRSHVFEDSFRELHRRNADEWKNRFYIVFEGKLCFSICVFFQLLRRKIFN